MLFKRALIAKLFIQIGLVSVTISKPSEHTYVSENWHKTQVFISYDIKTSNEQIIDCIGTILSPRFILTTAMCIELDSLKLKHAVITKVLGTDNHKMLAPDQANNIDTYRQIFCQ